MYSHFISLHSQKTFVREILLQFLNQIFIRINLLPGIPDLIKNNKLWHSYYSQGEAEFCSSTFKRIPRVVVGGFTVLIYKEVFMYIIKRIQKILFITVSPHCH